MSALTFAVFVALLSQSVAFQYGSRPMPAMRGGLSMSTSTTSAVKAIDAPDFYWQFRLNRLISKKGKEVPFNPKNYEATDYKGLYDTYYFDLLLQGKLKNFDWLSEQKINDQEWLEIYKSFSQWSQEVAKAKDPKSTTVPENDFDFIKAIYPTVDLRDLEVPFTADEIGPDLKYKNLKELLGAASKGELKGDGVLSLDASFGLKKLEELKARSFAAIEKIYQAELAIASSDFVDEDARKHYQQLRVKLASFPQSPADWEKFREDLEKQVDEQARLAAKKVDPHHHHGEEEGEHHEEEITPAQEFEAKYGKSLALLEERYNRFKSDPVAFTEKSIIEKFGRRGLDIWNQSQEFATLRATLSETEVKALEQEYADFLKRA